MWTIAGNWKRYHSSVLIGNHWRIEKAIKVRSSREELTAWFVYPYAWIIRINVWNHFLSLIRHVAFLKKRFFCRLEGHSFKGSLIRGGRLLLIVQSNSIFVHSQGDGDVDLQLDCFPFDRSHAWASPRNEFFYEEGNINVWRRTRKQKHRHLDGSARVE